MGGLSHLASVSCGLNQGAVCYSRGASTSNSDVHLLREKKYIHLPSQRNGDLTVTCAGPAIALRTVSQRIPGATLRTCTSIAADALVSGLGQVQGSVVTGAFAFTAAPGSRRSRSKFSLNCTSSSQGVDEGAGEGEHCHMPADYIGAPGTSAEDACDVSDLDRAPSECGSLESELSLYTCRMSALQRFREEVSKPDEEISVIRGAVCIAQHLYPNTSVEEVEAKFDKMVDEIRPTLPPPEERYPLRMIKVINDYLYDRGGWKGASVQLDPDNSCINSVLERREGLPITMSLVYMELAKRIGLQMQGVNLPAHFMCRPVGEDLEFLVDTFSEGKIMFLQDAEEKLSKNYGIPITLNPVVLKRARVSNRSFLTRILFNLKRFYYAKKDPVSTLCIINFLKLIRPDASDEVRDHGICLYLLRRFAEAVPCLEKYLEISPKAQDRESICQLLSRMRLCCAVNAKTINSFL